MTPIFWAKDHPMDLNRPVVLSLSLLNMCKLAGRLSRTVQFLIEEVEFFMTPAGMCGRTLRNQARESSPARIPFQEKSLLFSHHPSLFNSLNQKRCVITKLFLLLWTLCYVLISRIPISTFHSPSCFDFTAANLTETTNLIPEISRSLLLSLHPS